MQLVSTTKVLLQQLREDGLDLLLEKVESFCQKQEIDVPDMNVPYTAGRDRPRREMEPLTMECYFRVDVFYATTDSQLHELNKRFQDDVVELLMLCVSLDPTDDYRLFKVANICKLAEKFYPEDFSDHEKLHLKFQLEHFELDIRNHLAFQGLSTLQELCQDLMKTGKLTIYPLIDRLIRLVLTLPISTATTECAFSAMKIVKPKLRNKMEVDFLGSTLITYIEKEIARTFYSDTLVDEFCDMKERHLQFKM